MVNVKLPKYVNAWVDKRTGKVRCHFRRNRREPSVTLPSTIGSVEFWQAYYDALKAPVIGADRTKPGTFDALIVVYYEQCGKFLHEYSDATRAVRRGIIERWRQERHVTAKGCMANGQCSVSALTAEFAAAMIARIAKPHAKRNFRKAMHALMVFAVSIGMAKFNPFDAVKLDKLKKSSGHHTWTDEEVEQYRAHWPIGTVPRLAFELALETASRRSDVTQIGPQHVRNGVLRLRQLKTRAEVEIDVSSVLQAAIDAIPSAQRSMTFLTTRHGAPRSPKALGGDFRQWCDAAGLPKRCTMHGLRKANLRQIAEGGGTGHELMAVGGHPTLQQVAHYTEAADRKRLAASGMAKRARGKA